MQTSTALAQSGLTASQIALVRRTIAKDCNEDEFNLFMEQARLHRLDPFRKQIICAVYNKDKADKRQLVVIVTRDGLRAKAARSGDYRPASEPPEFTIDDAAKDPATNPMGLIDVTVRLWKRDPAGDWYPVAGRADWHEFAPIKEVWAYDEQERKRKPTGRYELDRSGQWGKMPRLMLQKCAEAQALRAGWPEEFGGLYIEEELHRAEADMTASEAIAAEAERERVAKAGAGRSILFSDINGVLERVEIGRIADYCAEFIGEAEPADVHAFAVRNREALKEFWAFAPGDALEVKKMIEGKTASLATAG